MFIPDPTFFHPRSRIQIFSIPDPGSTSKNLSILTQKIVLLLRKYDPGRSSRIRILIFYPSRIPRIKRHRIPDPDPQPLEREQNHSMKARIDTKNYIILAKHRLPRRWSRVPRTGLPPAAAPPRPRCSTSAPACYRTPGTPCSQ